MLLVFSPRFLYHPGTTLLLVRQGLCLGLPGTLTQFPQGSEPRLMPCVWASPGWHKKRRLSICRCLLID